MKADLQVDADLAWTIAELQQRCKVSRTKIYEEIAAGRLRTFSVGRRRLVLPEDAATWLRWHRSGGAAEGNDAASAA